MSQAIELFGTRRCAYLACALVTFAVAMWVGVFPVSPRLSVPAMQRHNAAPAARLAANFGKLPLTFEANHGQTDGTVKFLSRGRGYALFLTGSEAVLSLRSQESEVRSQEGASGLQFRRPLIQNPKSKIQNLSTSTEIVRLRLVGANAKAAVTGDGELPTKVNYFIGNDSKKWRTNLPTYAKVKYQGVYPGVDLVYHGSQSGQLEYDFVVAPGADAGAITLAVGAHGHAPLRIAADGDLVIPTKGGEVRLHKPLVYQEQSTVDSPQSTVQDENRKSAIGNRQFREGHFVLDAQNRVRFALGAYDHARPLVIDPELIYSTYLGGSDHEEGFGIAVDSLGNAYVAGTTWSTDFPTVNPLQPNKGSTGNGDSNNGFVAKLNAAGSALVYSTYLGGSVSDAVYGISVDSSGSAYVTGYTCSSDFPTVNALEASAKGHCDGFVAKLTTAGSALVYSTYLGGVGG